MSLILPQRRLWRPPLHSDRRRRGMIFTPGGGAAPGCHCAVGCDTCVAPPPQSVTVVFEGIGNSEYCASCSQFNDTFVLDIDTSFTSYGAMCIWVYRFPADLCITPLEYRIRLAIAYVINTGSVYYLYAGFARDYGNGTFGMHVVFKKQLTSTKPQCNDFASESLAPTTPLLYPCNVESATCELSAS